MKNTKNMISKIYDTLHAADLVELEHIYKNWAKKYENDVINLAGYVGHLITSELLLSYLKDTQAKILDAGCGTGLVGEILNKNEFKNLIGVDFSQEMLNIAKQKNVYKSLELADLTKKLDYEDNLFDAVICAGTFTCGHVGPEVLNEMVRITKNEGYICFTVREQEWEAAPYEKIIQSLKVSNSWFEVERHISDYNTQEGTNCQLCLFQVTK
ncbi:class I SAM-dependent DNA methyltransferase [Pseudothioglobus sp. nBUS_23]|uniref:class I SAM-dependent DNA methyltransferase n=1 Tax=Pseudothioglobus sp. nBUS_23 TaxID=3395318 RepID=UPI003EBA2185